MNFFSFAQSTHVEFQKKKRMCPFCASENFRPLIGYGNKIKHIHSKVGSNNNYLVISAKLDK
jgi:hypothetical protein